MMATGLKVLDQIIDSKKPLDIKDILDLILPPKRAQTYTLAQVDEALGTFHNDIETIQRQSNDEFDNMLDGPVQERLRNLSNDLNKTQLDVMKLNLCIVQAREQFNLAKDVCNDKVVQERREMLQAEQSLRESLQQSKFNSVRDFFERFVIHLDASIATCTKLLSYSLASNYLQSFDWTQYHRALFLLRACGQAMIDVDRLERLYQSCKDFLGLSFRQPIDKMDLNNFIEFYASYSLETQLDVVTNSQGDRCDLGRFIKEPKIELILRPTSALEYQLFKSTMDRLSTITIDCCRLLMDLNLNYIEAQFTDGINLDKLNGSDRATPAAVASQNEALPSYAFSPQEYITQIGQHLLALRKQTEKFDQIDNRPLILALEYLKYANTFTFDVRSSKTVTEIILKFIARQVVRSLVGRTTASVLSQLTVNGQKQIATDAMYLYNVLEDLNLLDTSDPPVEKFKHLFEQ